MVFGTSKGSEQTVGIHSLVITFPGPAVIKLFPCSTQLSIKFFLLIMLKLTIVDILTFYEQENLSEPESS